MITRRTGVLSALATLAAPSIARAAVSENDPIRIVGALGFTYLPTNVVLERKLIEKHAERLGISPTVDFKYVSTGGAINDAMLSDNCDVAPIGGTILIYLWSKTKEIRGIMSLIDSPISILTVDPGIRTLADYKEGDRIAMTTVKISTFAIVLQMAAAKQFGWDQRFRFDPLSVTLGAAESTAALLSGGTEIKSVAALAPFSAELLESPKVHEVLNSDDVLGGHGCLCTIAATRNFHERRPKAYQAVKAAYDEALVYLNENKRGAAEIYMKREPNRKGVDWITKVLENEKFVKYTRDPHSFEVYADFMHRIGSLPKAPDSWRDFFFDNGEGLLGS